MNEVIDTVFKNYDKIMFAGAIIGANVGTYTAYKDGYDDIMSYISHAGTGAITGFLAGGVSPIIVPGIIIGTPGYAISRIVNRAKACPPSASLPLS